MLNGRIAEAIARIAAFADRGYRTLSISDRELRIEARIPPIPASFWAWLDPNLGAWRVWTDGARLYCLRPKYLYAKAFWWLLVVCVSVAFLSGAGLSGIPKAGAAAL